MIPSAELVGGFFCGFIGGLIGTGAAIAVGMDGSAVWSFVGAAVLSAAGWSAWQRWGWDGKSSDHK
jgi:hypothetical protein